MFIIERHSLNRGSEYQESNVLSKNDTGNVIGIATMYIRITE